MGWVPLGCSSTPSTKNIDALTFHPWNSETPMTWETSLWENYTDGILVLHRGKIVFERYFAELTEDRLHAAMSVTKSFTGTLAATLLAEGLLDENKTVVEYVPELKGSAFRRRYRSAGDGHDDRSKVQRRLFRPQC